jgi:proline dehydrogenase
MTNPATQLTTVELLEALRTNPEARAAIDSLYGKGHNAARDAEIAQKVWAGATHASVARAYNLSVNRIAQIMSSRPNPNPVKVNPNAERNRLILDAARKKVPRAEIARQHGLSVIRVNQIVGEAPKEVRRSFQDRAREALRKYDAWEDLTFDEECLIMWAKYESKATEITQTIIEGMSPQLAFTWGFPADCTGGDIKWTPEHYQAIAEIMYDFKSGIWKKYAPL